MLKLSRRGLLGLAASLPVVSSRARELWDESYDVVVVGSGYAGLAAGIEAASAGGSVLVIEKMESFGGNSALSTGDMAVPGTPIQRRLGILNDSPQRMAEDLLRLGRINDPVRCRIVSEGAYDTWRWTVETLGVHWLPDALQLDEGQSVPRGCIVRGRSGMSIITAELNEAQKREIEVRACCKMLGLEMSGGIVEGILALRDYRFPDEKSGRRVRIRARKGVVLCSGGFGADVAFRSRLDPRLGAHFPTDNQPGATAEVLTAAARHGARLVDMEQIQVLAWISADEVGIGNAWSYIEHVASPYGIWVTNEGRRFVNERGFQAERAGRTVTVIAGGGRVYAIVDAVGFERSGNTGRRTDDWSHLVRRGIIRAYPTIEALCRDNGMPEENLRATIERYNWRFVSLAEHTDPFGREVQPGEAPLKNPPWYLIEIQPKVHHCMGGLAIDEKARVLHRDGRPIPGLFAAGEVTGGTFGVSRAPCHSSTDALVTGRIAGREAALGA